MYRIGNGYDAHQLSENRKLVLGGIEVPHTHGLAGHSDGDAVLHSLSNALLGSMALGDIGQYFPSSDKSIENIDSAVILKICYDLVIKGGYELSNADIMIIAQKPKLLPFRDAMRERISNILDTDISKISVKATTTDHLGAIGRCEGIACMATVLIKKK